MIVNHTLVEFILSVSFSFLIGLEIKAYRLQFGKNSEKEFFGTTRTFSFIGIVGFIFYKIEPLHFLVFIAGLIGLTLLYAIFYIEKVKEKKFSILLYLIMLIVYSMGAITTIYPLWMGALIFVFIVFILNSKNIIYRFSSAINTYEFETLGKMILLSAVILPLLPKTNVIPFVPLSPFKIWLAVVVISAISYGGYLVEKYFMPSKGLFLTGIIGGTYSSTATTVVLSRKLKQMGKNYTANAAVIASTSVMFLRLIVVAFIFNPTIAKTVSIPFLTLSIVGFAISYFYLKQTKKDSLATDFVDKNPLELGTAFLFAFLFVVMIMLTHFITTKYGSNGLEMFSFVVGLTDIDPFILSILTGKYVVSQNELVNAILIAAGSNNLIKAIYALYFGGVKNSYISAFWVSVLGLASIVWSFVV